MLISKQNQKNRKIMTINNQSYIELDREDREILDLLQNDAKLTIKEISEKVGYVALIDCRQLGYREMVMASLRVNSAQPIEQIKVKIEEMEEIKYAYIITGEYPLFIMAKCQDHEDSMNLIQKLRVLPGVEEVKTQIVLDRIKEDTTIIIPEKIKRP
jgi:Lrp/AsnC family leucine-responsive transcriptional regulator